MQNLDHLGCYLVSRSLGRTTQTSGCAGHLLTIPDVLQEPNYTRALSLSRLAYDLENLLSPLLAALLLLAIGHDRLFLLTSLGFLASALLVVSVVLPKPGGP